MIANIHKRRERLKKKKAEERQQQKQQQQRHADSDDEQDPHQSALNARRVMQSRQKEFEDAIHGSESELEDSDDADDDHYIPEQFKDSIRKVKKI